MKYLLLTSSLIFTLHTGFARGDAPSATSPEAAAAGQPASFSGKVLQATNAASYTYVQVDTGKQKLWAAAPQFQVKPGDQLAVADGMPMSNYHSKTLDRDFDVVYFTGSVQVNGAKPAADSGVPEIPKNHPPMHSAMNNTHAPIDYSGIKKAPGGKTVQEVCAGAAKLSGKEVKVRGRVVKYNAQIMGKNWIHLRDGTGTPGSNDLLVTTSDQAKLGDTVLVTGKVATNKDFGMNYKYPVMIEDGKVTVESGAATAP